MNALAAACRMAVLSPLFFIWLVWLSPLLVLAVVRLVVVGRTQRKRAQRWFERLARRMDPTVHSNTGRPALPPNYREQLIAAGIIQPAPDPAPADPSV